MTNNHTSHNYEDFKPLDGNKDTNSQRVDDLTNALKGNSALRARVAEITDAFKKIPQPELRELTDQEKDMDMHYVFFSPSTYVQHAFDHNVDQDITLYRINKNVVASTFAINGTLADAEAFKERSSDDIYLGIGEKMYTRKIWNTSALNEVGFMIGKPGTRINKWLHDSEQLEHLEDNEDPQQEERKERDHDIIVKPLDEETSRQIVEPIIESKKKYDSKHNHAMNVLTNMREKNRKSE